MDRIILTAEPLDAPSLLGELGAEEHGAIVSFAGIVRRSEGELSLRAIDYEIYDEMARRKIEELLREARARFPEFRAVIAHRAGEVPVGEASVWIGVSAGHRAEAFELARFFIDELKARVPIWKREHLPEASALDSAKTVE